VTLDALNGTSFSEEEEKKKKMMMNILNSRIFLTTVD
jgi:hypothetical protein